MVSCRLWFPNLYFPAIDLYLLMLAILTTHTEACHVDVYTWLIIVCAFWRDLV